MTANDGLLTFKCVDCNKTYEKSLMKIYPRDFKAPTNSVMETLTNFVPCCEKAFIHTSTWIAGRDLMKRHYRKRRNFTATRQ